MKGLAVMEELLKRVNNRFLLVVGASKRGRQLQEGAHPLIPQEELGDTYVISSLKEIHAGKVAVEVDTEFVDEKIRKPKKLMSTKVSEKDDDKKIKDKDSKDKDKKASSKVKKKSVVA
jgi:DNA-directed RNA polymerase omega subunit